MDSAGLVSEDEEVQQGHRGRACQTKPDERAGESYRFQYTPGACQPTGAQLHLFAGIALVLDRQPVEP